MINFTGDSRIGFGKHLGKKLADIPDSYFLWLMKQDWFVNSKDSYNIEFKTWINNIFNKCDVCGLLTRDDFPVYNENHIKQKGLIQCFKHTF